MTEPITPEHAAAELERRAALELLAEYFNHGDSGHFYDRVKLFLSITTAPSATPVPAVEHQPPERYPGNRVVQALEKLRGLHPVVDANIPTLQAWAVIDASNARFVGERTIPHTPQRWSIEMNGDDQIIEHAPDGEWMRAEDVLPLIARLSDRDQLRDALGRLAQDLTAATAELTRWRAMFNTPDIAQRHVDQINARLTRIEATATANSALIERLLAARAPVTPEEPGGQ